MARINIEDCWWTDPRRDKLIRLLGDSDQADGAVVRMWRLAQEFWKHGSGKIPAHIFETMACAEQLLGCGLAVLGDDGVYVRGSCQYLDWVREVKEKAALNGSKGGKKSAQRPRNAKGQLLRTAENTQAPAKQKPSDDQAEPSTSKLSGSGSYSGSYSGSSSSSEIKACADFQSGASVEVVVPIGKPTVQHVIAAYCEVWKARYGASPPIGGKEAGLIRRLAKDHGETKAIGFIEAYLRMPDPWFVTKRHDLATLSASLNAVAHFIETGRVVTRSDVRQLDQAVTNQGTLDAIRRGEV